MKTTNIKKTQVSEVQIRPVKPHNGLIAFASFVLDNKYYVSSVAIYTKLTGGFRLVYPTKTIKDKSGINVFHPITRPASKAIEDAIFKKINALYNDPYKLPTNQFKINNND